MCFNLEGRELNKLAKLLEIFYLTSSVLTEALDLSEIDDLVEIACMRVRVRHKNQVISVCSDVSTQNTESLTT